MPQSIEGGVVIINTLSTKNNGNYPLVMAESVEMKNGKNVEDEITEITENISGIINDADINQSSTWSSENIVSRLCPPFTTEGAIVTCQPVEGSRLNTVVQIEPVQEGTGDPSPENVRQISGWDSINIWHGGKNLYSSVYDDYNPPTKDYATLELKLPNGKYCFHAKQIGETVTGVAVGFADSGTEYANFENFSGVLWAEGNVTAYPIVREVKNGRLILAVYVGGIAFDKSLFDSIFQNYQIQMEYGDTATEYEPYRGKTFTIALGQTVYGGTLDVRRGVLTVDRVLRTLSDSEHWLLSFEESNSLYWHSIILQGSEIADYLQANKSVSSHLKYGINTENGFWFANSGNNLRIANNISTTEEWKDYLISENSSGHPVQVVYYIATPVTLQLTPQEIRALSGVNTVYADAGDVTVSGYSDPNAIINSLADRIAALESATTSLIINELDYN